MRGSARLSFWPLLLWFGFNDRVVMLQVDYLELARCLRCISDRGCEAAYKYCWDPCRQIDLDH